MQWKTILSFLVSVTLLILLIGWLMTTNLLPLRPELSYSEAGRSFMKVWFQIAVALGLVMPGVAFLIWIRHSKIRMILGGYLLVLVVQILTERILSRVFSSSLLVVIGTLYTAFRIWQLWQSQKMVKTNVQSRYHRDRILQLILWLLLLFWSANLVVLFTLFGSVIR